MPRTAADATRFTATGPYASSKPTSSSSTSIPPSTTNPAFAALGSGAPANETPQQKIARLRAAAARAKLGQESKFDKVVRRGRVWADRAHRTTAWSLIGLTVVCGVFATFSIGDMLLHNRRKRNEWLVEQQEKSARLLEEAYSAAKMGVANDDQILLINRERAAREARQREEAEKANARSWFGRARDKVVEVAREEEGRSNNAAAARQAATAAGLAGGAGTSIGVVRPPPPPPPSGFLEDVNAEERSSVGARGAATGIARQEEMVFVGGPLDRQAAASTSAITQASRSWWHSITGR